MDSGDFLRKIKQIRNVSENYILVTTDVVQLYPFISHKLGLKALEKALDKGESKQISTDDLIKLAKSVLQNNFFHFNGEVKQKISGTAIGTRVEFEVLKTQLHQPLIWFRYTDIFSSRLMAKRN